MQQAFKYRAFLSYSHHDRKRAERLHRELERYRIPPLLRQQRDLPRRLGKFFRDSDELPSGTDLPRVIEQALHDSAALIVVCSPAAATSEWVNKEIRTFQQLGRSERIFCFVVDGEPGATGPRNCLPDALVHPDGGMQAGSAEPVAADARGGRAHWRHARLMLIAGLLGVGLDELVQRDLHHRHRKMVGLAAGSVALAVLMAGLTLFAFHSRAEAERRRSEAENLVGFLLGDLREELHSIGRVELYGRVASKAMEYFQDMDAAEARAEILAQRAEALRQIGTARMDSAQTEQAIAAFRESLSITRELVERDPGRLDWNLALAQNHFHVGQVYWEQGDLEAAGREFLNQLNVVDRLALAEPDNAERLEHSGYAWTNYGRILESSGRYDEARAAYETVKSIFERLVALQPGSNEARLELGFAHNNLGKLKLSLGQLDEAESHFRQDLAVKQQVAAINPAHHLWRENLASSHYWLGIGLSLKGQWHEAREQFESALELLDILLINDPGVIRLRQRKAAVQTEIAAICRMNEQTECAASLIDDALAGLDALITINPDNVKLQMDQAHAQLEAAWQAGLASRQARGLQLAQSAVHAAAQLALRTAGDHDVRKLQVLALLALGDLSDAGDTPRAAADHWQQGLNLLEQYFQESSDPRVLEAKAHLLARLGFAPQARELENSLNRMNYHGSYMRP